MSKPLTTEQISDLVWRQPGRGARLIVDLDAIEGNVRILKNAGGADVRLLAVVKANGYGCGGVEAANAALAGGANWLGVATVREGKMLREAGISAPVLVLGPTMASEAAECLEPDISLTIGSLQHLESLLSDLPSSGSAKLGVHLKVDTGMHRFGVEPDSAVHAARRIADSPRVDLQGVFTHFARADEADAGPTYRQAERFRDILNELERAGIERGVVHVSNSAATLRFRELDFDMVRPGICIYGVRPDPQIALLPGMSQAVTIEAVIQRVSEIPSGDEVGYGGTFRAGAETRTALLSLGYADGYLRSLSGRSWAGFRGQRLQEIGRVSMDQTVFELTEQCDAGYGDVIRLAGDGSWGEPTIEELASMAGTISYEILTGLGQRLPVFHHSGGDVVARNTE